jgi:hypothetical protein
MNYVNSKVVLLKFGNSRIVDSFNLAYAIDYEKYNKKIESNRCIVSWIWGSHGGEYEDGCLLGCSSV